jgi:hypothetical protein
MWLNRLLALEVKSHGSWLLVDWSGPIVGWVGLHRCHFFAHR